MIDVLRGLVEKLQGIVDEWLTPARLDTGTCSQEFLSLLDRLEEEADRAAARMGWRKLDPALARRTGEQAEDLVVAVFLAPPGLLVEVGIRGYNRCAPIASLYEAVGKPRVYARLRTATETLATVEAEEKKEAKPKLDYIYY